MALRAEQTGFGLSRLLVPGIVRLALEMGAAETGGALAPSEQDVVREALEAPRPLPGDVKLVRGLAADGRDPLGEALCAALSSAERRPVGAVYTPPALVEPMVAWVLGQHPSRIVDMGCGSGRFTVAAARGNPSTELLAVDIDPVATLICRANVALAGASRVRVVLGDYTQLDLPPTSARTAFVGNPPYVRHHAISPVAKAWAKQAARDLGLVASSLAGLHVHFYLATAHHAHRGDVGCLVTSAEWLDVGYGAVLRALLVGRLGVQSLHLLDPKSQPFAGAMTTAIVAAFEVENGTGPVRFRFVHDGEPLGDLAYGGQMIDRSKAVEAARWSQFFVPARRHSTRPSKAQTEALPRLVRLGSVVRVSRGIATGMNNFFVMTAEEARSRGLAPFARPAVTSAKQVISSPGVIRVTPSHKVLIDLPRVLDGQDTATAAALKYISEGEAIGVSERYLCRHRTPWWSLGVGAAPRAVATYMARQAPVFALNPDGLVLLNIAHGLYPRVTMTDEELAALVAYLNEVRQSYCGQGRTYHGGLEKFEPREMESLPVPVLEHLRAPKGSHPSL